ncbi:hypothetical protein E0K89_004045 [Aquicoccus sp. SCR17]|nr:hypothetical protein [Carideicomes alvinocaridis]
MSFVRPEVRAALWRWREVLVALALALLGIWWVLTGGLLQWIGVALLLAAGALAVAGVQRGRFRGAGGGPGVVQVVEGQVSYFGPLTGGVASLSDLSELRLDPTARPAHWLLFRPKEPPLAIPVNAEGAEDLFDAFATLPGLRTERMLAELRHSAHPVVIWQRRSQRSEQLRLH